MEGTPVDVAVLYGDKEFPVSMAKKTQEVPESWVEPKMFYVWVFSTQESDFIPIGAFHDREPAEQLLKDFCKKNSGGRDPYPPRGAVLEQPWRDFVAMSVSARLKELAEPLKEISAFAKALQRCPTVS